MGGGGTLNYVLLGSYASDLLSNSTLFVLFGLRAKHFTLLHSNAASPLRSPQPGFLHLRGETRDSHLSTLIVKSRGKSQKQCGESCHLGYAELASHKGFLQVLAQYTRSLVDNCLKGVTLCLSPLASQIQHASFLSSSVSSCQSFSEAASRVGVGALWVVYLRVYLRVGAACM
jgi:hypothetical protein